MKEIPILFSTPMVQAILAGRKSITRRMQGLEKINEKPDNYAYNYAYKGIHPENPSVHIFGRLFLGVWVETIYIKCPYGQPGDVLWVRETFMRMPREGFFNYKAHHPIFKYADDKIQLLKEFGLKWKPSIHMPKEAARIWLKVVNVRVERLHEITEQDAIAEGVETLGLYPGYSVSSRGKFEGLWNHINGAESWDSNPWVWVVEFEVLSTTGQPCSI